MTTNASPILTLHMRSTFSSEGLVSTRSLLAIPLSEILRHCLFPLKWLRFIGYAVCGIQGHLRTIKEETVDYGQTKNLVDHYIFVPVSPDTYLTFVDPNGVASSITQSSQICDQRFIQKVQDRDGRRCLFSQASKNVCEVTHIVPYSKGNMYIETLMRRRVQAAAAAGLATTSLITDIDDPRNALNVNANLHNTLFRVPTPNGDSVAVLVTPNFAMETTDVPPSPLNLLSSPPHEEKNYRMTLQYLRVSSDLTIVEGGLHNLDARASWDLTHPDAPSALLLDYAYGTLVIHLWATTEFRQFLQETTEDRYPPKPARDRLSALQDRRMDEESDDVWDGMLEFSHRVQAPFLAAYERAEAEARSRDIQQWLKGTGND